MKLKVKYITILAILVCGLANAQQLQQDEETKRWFAGGYIGAQFGDITLIDISPMIGYMLTESFAIGAGLTYKYYRIKGYFDPGLNRKTHFTSHIFGGNSFARFFVTPQFFAHTEYELLRYNNENSGNVTFHSVFIGGGYRQYFSASSAFEILLLYNLNETPNSPYTNPVIRMGVAIGL